MKRVWIWVLLLFCPAAALAQSETATNQANCSASFLGNCPIEQTVTTSSDGFAAPIGLLGSSGLEGLLVALLIAGGIGSQLYRRAADGAVSGNRNGSFEHLKPGGRAMRSGKPSRGQLLSTRSAPIRSRPIDWLDEAFMKVLRIFRR
jgi:hypothetical protein